MATIHAADLPVLRSFLDRESRDFSSITDVIRPAWVEQRVINIQEKIKDMDCSWVRVVRIGNTGCTIGELKIDVMTRESDWRNTAEAVLCSCGQDRCWGSVRLERRGAVEEAK